MRYRLACWLIGLGVLTSSRHSTLRHKWSYLRNPRRMAQLGAFTLNAAQWAGIMHAAALDDSEEASPDE